MKIELDLPESTAYYFNSVMVPVLKDSNEDNDIVANEFERAFKQAQVSEGHIKESNDD